VNEYKAWIDADGDLYIGKNETECEWTASTEGIDALREFFRAEEDERLHRWRSPEHPEYIVHIHEGGRYVWVSKEVGGSSTGAFYRGAKDTMGEYAVARVARAYFDAHPEPKPWHAAQHDEIWLLTTPATGDRPYQVVRTEEAGFRFFLISDHEGFRPGLFPDEAQITAGRRIYPEGDS
jgi:hypothetical protein